MKHFTLPKNGRYIPLSTFRERWPEAVRGLIDIDVVVNECVFWIDATTLKLHVAHVFSPVSKSWSSVVPEMSMVWSVGGAEWIFHNRS